MVAPPAIISTEFLHMVTILICTATVIIKIIIILYYEYSVLECLTGEH